MWHALRLPTRALQLVAALALCVLVAVCAESVPADDKTVGYNLKLAEQMALMSSASNCPDYGSILNWTCVPCQYDAELSDCVGQGIAEKHSVLGFVVTCPKLNAVVAVFRGSVNFENRLQDLSAYPAKYGVLPGTRVHWGINTAWSYIRGNMTRLIKEGIAKMPSNAVVHVTGHSMGGALATLAAAEWADEPGIELAGRESSRIYTYGEPRLGNKAFANAYSALYGYRHLRIVNADDPIPHLPPKFLSLYHESAEVWYPKVGQSIHDEHVVCPLPESRACSRSVPLWEYKQPDHRTYWNIGIGHCNVTAPAT